MSILSARNLKEKQITLRPKELEDLRWILKLLRKGIKVDGKSYQVNKSGIGI